MNAENTLRVAPQATDLESFIASGERLYQKQRQKLMDDEQAYRQERFSWRTSCANSKPATPRRRPTGCVCSTP